jgi:hypothetical protein
MSNNWPARSQIKAIVPKRAPPTCGVKMVVELLEDKGRWNPFVELARKDHYFTSGTS